MLGQEQIHRNLSSHPPNIATPPQKTFLPRFPRPVLPEHWAVIWQPWRMSRNTWTPHDDKTEVWIYNLQCDSYMCILGFLILTLVWNSETNKHTLHKSPKIWAARRSFLGLHVFNKVLAFKSTGLKTRSRKTSLTGLEGGQKGTNLQSLQELAGRCANHHLCLRSHSSWWLVLPKDFEGMIVQMTNYSMILPVKLNLSMGQAG